MSNVQYSLPKDIIPSSDHYSVDVKQKGKTYEAQITYHGHSVEKKAVEKKDPLAGAESKSLRITITADSKEQASSKLDQTLKVLNEVASKKGGFSSIFTGTADNQKDIEKNFNKHVKKENPLVRACKTIARVFAKCAPSAGDRSPATSATDLQLAKDIPPNPEFIAPVSLSRAHSTPELQLQKEIQPNPEFIALKAILKEIGSAPGKKRIILGSDNTLECVDAGLKVGDLKVIKSGADAAALRVMYKTLIKSTESDVGERFKASIDIEKLLSHAEQSRVQALNQNQWDKKLKKHPELKALKEITSIGLALAQGNKTTPENLNAFIQSYNESAEVFHKNPALPDIEELKSIMLIVGKSLVETKANLGNLPSLESVDGYIDLIGSAKPEDQGAKEILLLGHRNNSHTVDLFTPMIAKMQDPETSIDYKQNLLNFSKEYLEKGYSLPINPVEIDALKNQMLEIVTSAGNVEELKTAALDIKGLVEEHLTVKKSEGLQVKSLSQSSGDSYDFENLSAEMIYEDLSAMTKNTFLNIKVNDFDREGWAKKDKNFALSLREDPVLINQMTHFLSTKMMAVGLNEKDPEKDPVENQKKVAQAMEKVNKIGEFALKNHNLTLCQIVNATLNSAEIGRLLDTKNNFKIESFMANGDAALDTVKKLKSLASSDANSQALRLETTQSLLKKEKIVPFVGAVLTDFTFLNENSDLDKGDLINGNKIQQFAYLKKSVLMLQENLRDENPLSINQNLLNALAEAQKQQTESLYKASLSVYPRPPAQ